MGDEKKSRKRRASPSSSSEDENDRNRKHSKRGGEKKSKSRKHDKERKKRKKYREHAASREAKEKKAKGKHKHSKKQSDLGFKELSDEDYFSKNNEFSTWLKEERGIYFSDLSSEAARDLFSSFIKAWNRQKLQPQYYDGIASAPRTAHNWKIKREK